MLTEATFPPFEYLGNDNKVAGVDIDIAAEIAKDLGMELEVQAMDFDGIIPSIVSGKGDMGIAGISVNEERKQSVDFSINYVDATLLIIVHKDNADILTADDLVGKTVGVQLGTTSDLLVSDVEGVKEIVRYKSALESALDLSSKRLDAIVLDQLPAQQMIQANSDLKIIEEPLAVEQYAIAIKKGNTELLNAVNKTLERLIKEGFVDKKIDEHKASFAG